LVSFTANDSAGCPTLCIQFNNTTPNTGSLRWDLDDNSVSSSPNPTHCYSNTGSYSVSLIVTDNNGCVGSLTKNNYITVYPVPTASFVATPQPTTILNPTINFTDLSQQNIVNWNWDFGYTDNTTSSLQNPSFTYGATGSYPVQLTVSNIYGCTAYTSDTVVIKPDYAIFVPNSFTPNGDGLNDFFIPQGVGINSEYYHLYIFDRWGILIFESTDTAKGWDGKVKDSQLSAQIDTYVWKVITQDVDYRKQKYIGHVNLLR
jgi:gliding motility-associated-like protein